MPNRYLLPLAVLEVIGYVQWASSDYLYSFVIAPLCLFCYLLALFFQTIGNALVLPVNAPFPVGNCLPQFVNSGLEATWVGGSLLRGFDRYTESNKQE